MYNSLSDFLSCGQGLLGAVLKVLGLWLLCCLEACWVVLMPREETPLLASLHVSMLHYSSFLHIGLQILMVSYCAPKLYSKTVIRDHHIFTGVHTQMPADYVSGGKG